MTRKQLHSLAEVKAWMNQFIGQQFTTQTERMGEPATRSWETFRANGVPVLEIEKGSHVKLPMVFALMP